jgi:mRNA interferase MazF
MKRGEIWTFIGHGYGSKPRPGIIIQSDRYAPATSVTVIPVTTSESEVGRVRTQLDIVGPQGSRRSFAMVDKIVTIKATDFGARIGELTLKEMRALERVLLGHLGFGSRLPAKRKR